MLPLSEHLDEPLALQAMQVHARCGRVDLAEHCQLGAGSCPAIGEPARARMLYSLADGGGNPGDGGVGMFDIHTLIVSEV